MISKTDNGEDLRFHYKLGFKDGKVLLFDIDIHAGDFIAPSLESPPFWTALDYCQCENCPLSLKDTSHCPVSVNLIPLIELCSALVSYEDVQFEVTTRERTVSGDTSLQRALSSMMGLIMATSPCPHTEYLKPMAQFHLPLASPEETIYRTTSMFLLAQYFLHKQGKDASFDLKKLTEINQNLQIVNRALARRFKAAISEDATLNAIILLNLLSQSVTWSIEDGLEHLRYLFKRYDIE